MRLVSRTRSRLSSSRIRVHSRSSTTIGADAPTRRRQCGSVRSADASTRASAVVLGARRRVPVAEPVELPGVDRVHRQAVPRQALQHRPARRLDGHADRLRRRPGDGLGDPRRHRRQTRPAVRERALATHRAVVAEHADLVASPTPVHADVPVQFGHLSSSSAVAAQSRACHDACLSLYWRSRRELFTGRPSWQNRRGTSPTLVLAARGTPSGSRRSARLRALRHEAVENGTGDALNGKVASRVGQSCAVPATRCHH